MILKVSDFCLAEAILKTLCRAKGCTFVDVPVFFKDEENITEEGIFVSGSKNVGHTIYKIVSQYVKLSSKIINKELFINREEMEDFFISVATVLRKVVYDDNKFSHNIGELSLGNLYQKTMVWILMEDLICPVFDVSCKNVKIVHGENSFMDIARYCTKEELKSNSKIQYPFIFVNEIENHIVQNAFIFIEALKAHDLEPIKVVKDIFESELYEKFRGILLLFLENERNVDEFISIIVDLLGIDFWSFLASKTASGKMDVRKFAQQAQHTDMSSQFWYIGLLESMMEPVRGTDWSTHIVLDKYRSDFWDKVEEIKRKKASNGLEQGLTFNELLRLKTKQSTDHKIDPNKTLQSLLSSNRVW